MKYASRILFYYCAIVTTFIFLGTFLNARSNTSLATALLLLPVVSYFGYTIVRGLKNKQYRKNTIDAAVSFNFKKIFISIALLFLLTLLALGSIAQNQKEQSNKRSDSPIIIKNRIDSKFIDMNMMILENVNYSKQLEIENVTIKLENKINTISQTETT